MIEGLTEEEAARLIRRCRYFDILDALLSGERLGITVQWLDRMRRRKR